MPRDSDASSTKCNISKKWLETGCGCACKYLVYESNHFLIFVDNELDIDWCTEDELDDLIKSDKFNSIRSQITTLEAMECHHNDDIKIAFKRILGESLACACQGHFEAAQKALNNASEYLNKKNAEITRRWILEGSSWYALVAIIIILVLSFFYPNIPTGFYKKCFWFFLALPFGVIGAFLSIRLRIGTSFTDCASGKSSHIAEARGRIFSGALSALLVALAVYSGFALPDAIPASDKHYFMMLASCAAGFSERWAPAILEQISKKKDKK